MNTKWLMRTNVLYQIVCPSEDCKLQKHSYVGYTCTTLSRRLTIYNQAGTVKTYMKENMTWHSYGNNYIFFHPNSSKWSSNSNTFHPNSKRWTLNSKKKVSAGVQKAVLTFKKCRTVSNRWITTRKSEIQFQKDSIQFQTLRCMPLFHVWVSLHHNTSSIFVQQRTSIGNQHTYQ